MGLFDKIKEKESAKPSKAEKTSNEELELSVE